MQKGRPHRVGEEVRKTLADLLTKGLKDPRIGFVSVMEVRMSPDLRHANCYVSLLGSESERKSSLAGLRSASGWLRREVSKRLRLRFSPEMRFFEDTTLERVFHLEDVFREMHEDDEQTQERNGDAEE
jgi:ribosome-binding factor A